MRRVTTSRTRREMPHQNPEFSKPLENKDSWNHAQMSERNKNYTIQPNRNLCTTKPDPFNRWVYLHQTLQDKEQMPRPHILKYG